MMLAHPVVRRDLLRLPVIGPLLRWRWGRLLFQLPLLLLVGLVIYDGLTGPQLAPQNVATVAAWIHYRGLVILALLLAGNLFCMGCPFTLPRTLARRMSGAGRRWPRLLRNKWPAIGLLVALFWAYEWLDLWASPWLTAWLAIGYFVGAFVLEGLFAESPFCKYLCPLGTFNFTASTLSPLQITARSIQVCRTCEGRECINGSEKAGILGCGTELYVPQVHSNMDCTLCLDCARACPHDNVALAVRMPLQELKAESWPRRWDVSFLLLVFAFAGVSNAFGMVPPVYVLEARLAAWLNTTNEALILLLILGTANLVLPAILAVGAAWLSRALAGERGRSPAGGPSRSQLTVRGRPEPLRVVLARYAPVFLTLGFAIWLAHYGFHFATGALTIVPVLQNFLVDHGITLLGTQPNWALGPVLPSDWLLPLETLVLVAGFLASLYLLNQKAQQAHDDSTIARRASLPWMLLLLALALAAQYLFTLPMEMRGMML